MSEMLLAIYLFGIVPGALAGVSMAIDVYEKEGAPVWFILALIIAWVVGWPIAVGLLAGQYGFDVRTRNLAKSRSAGVKEGE